jgi:penicillin-insensitive murein endopeptidase
MFVSRELWRRLLAEGARRNTDPEILARVARVLYQPSAGGRHRDHFHVRIYCDASDSPRCRDDGPRHPWLRGSSALEEAVGRGLTGLEDVALAVEWFTAPPAPPEGDPETADEEPTRRRTRGRTRSRRSRRRH